MKKPAKKAAKPAKKAAAKPVKKAVKAKPVKGGKAAKPTKAAKPSKKAVVKKVIKKVVSKKPIIKKSVKPVKSLKKAVKSATAGKTAAKAAVKKSIKKVAPKKIAKKPLKKSAPKPKAAVKKTVKKIQKPVVLVKQVKTKAPAKPAEKKPLKKSAPAKEKEKEKPVTASKPVKPVKPEPPKAEKVKPARRGKKSKKADDDDEPAIEIDPLIEEIIRSTKKKTSQPKKPKLIQTFVNPMASLVVALPPDSGKKSSAPKKEPKGKFELEYVVRTSAGILYEFLTSPSGLSEWFADDVNIRDGIFTFYWDGSEQKARLLNFKDDKYVRMQWVDKPEGTYFEFRIEKDELTGDISLIIVDFADEGSDLETSKRLWDSQVNKLLHVIGSY
ncbi:MAG: hypothetical protein JWO09_16 [Bacteroidetes bacterium]|nr:hypothetical protein [Bacteroidota bacterium]